MPSSRTSATDPIEQLLALIDEAFDRPAWHGNNLRGSLRRITPQQITWRPDRDSNTVWELVLHAAYWKYTVRRRLTGETHGRFARAGSNFFPRPDSIDTFDSSSWKADVALLISEHRQLRDVVAGIDPRDLNRRAHGRHTRGFMIRGIAAHDLYHAGQIQLLKKLAERAAAR